jgi:carboxymethylenebutenolidase
MREPDSKTVLKDAFAKAKVTAEVEVYLAAHCWCPPDTQVYNKDQSEKAWAACSCSRNPRLARPRSGDRMAVPVFLRARRL